MREAESDKIAMQPGSWSGPLGGEYNRRIHNHAAITLFQLDSLPV